MNQHTLEDQLKQGREQAEAFFARSDMASLRERVLRRAACEEAARTVQAAQYSRRRAWVGTAAAVFCALACLAVLLVYNPVGRRRTDTVGSSRQSVALDDSGTAYEVSFTPVDVPESEPGLLGILWAMNEGTPQMLYTSLFEGSSEPYPISTLAMPGENRRALLLASGDTDRSFLHYRLVTLTTQGMATLWSQDFVPMGRLGIQDGVLVEHRNAVEGYPAFSSGEERMQTSYIVPLGMLDIHTVALPVDRMEIHVGDTILFVSDNASELTASSQSGVMRRLEQENGLYDGFEGVIFFASGTGDDVLTLTSGQGAAPEQIMLSVLQ